MQEIKTKFQFQPNLLSEFEKLKRDIKIAESNFASIISAKEKYTFPDGKTGEVWTQRNGD